MRLELAHRMWDEARHIEIVAKVVEEELGGELGYGPWSLVWWWMQNEEDPLRQLCDWARDAVAHIEGFYAGDDYQGADDVKFTFMKDGGRDEHRGPVVIGE